jgi:hypothetical protein
MANVLTVKAFELGDPVAVVVAVEAADPSFHRLSVTVTVVTSPPAPRPPTQ